MEYETITQHTTIFDEDTGMTVPCEVVMRFTQKGLGKYGTFLLEHSPQAHEIGVIESFEANWALTSRFEDMGATVISWVKFERFVSELYMEESELDAEPLVDVAMNFLQGGSCYSAARELPLVKMFKI